MNRRRANNSKDSTKANESKPGWAKLRDLARSAFSKDDAKANKQDAKSNTDDDGNLMNEVMDRLANSNDKEVAAYRDAYLEKKRQKEETIFADAWKAVQDDDFGVDSMRSIEAATESFRNLSSRTHGGSIAEE